MILLLMSRLLPEIPLVLSEATVQNCGWSWWLRVFMLNSFVCKFLHVCVYVCMCVVCFAYVYG